MSKHNNAEEAVSGDRQKGSFEVSSNNRPATQPVPPPAAGDPLPPQYYPQDHNVAPQEERLPCGIGIGWILFILGFFLVLPWYVGGILRVHSKMDRREKPGLLACAIAAAFCLFVVIIIARLHLFLEYV